MSFDEILESFETLECFESFGRAGVKTPNRFTRGFMFGHEDVHPSTGRRESCKADLPPSEEYVRQNIYTSKPICDVIFGRNPVVRSSSIKLTRSSE